MALSEPEELEMLRLRKRKAMESAAPEAAADAPQDAPRRSPMEMLGHQMGLTARAGIEGSLGFPLAVTDAPHTVARAFGYKGGQTASEALHSGLTRLGLPEPETGTERVVQDVAGAMAGTAGLAKGVGKGAVRLSEVLSGGASGGISGASDELGLPPWMGTLAGSVPLARTGKLGLKPPKPGMEVHSDIINRAKERGYVLPPTQTLEGKALTAVAGKGPIKANATIRNQEVTNKIAREESGLRENEPITEDNLAAARERMAAPYNEVAEVSPKAKSALKSLRQARVDARNQWKFYNSYGSQGYANPAVKQKAETLDRKADFYENIIKNEAVRIAQEQMKLAKPRGKGGKFISPSEEGKRLGQSLVEDLRKARVNLAKNYQVDRANSPGGNVDAKVIARDARGNKAMSGGLRDIADFEIERRPYFGVEMALDPDIRIGGGIGLSHLGGWGYLGAGIPGVRGLARKVAMSSAVQRPEYRSGIPLSAVTNFLANRHDYKDTPSADDEKQIGRR